VRRKLISAACFVAAATVWGTASLAAAADLTAGGPAGPLYARTEYELKWDNGTMGSALSYYTGYGTWMGNDFNVSTLKSTHGYISRIGVALSPQPNSIWEGVRLAIFGWPGGIIWPESGTGYFYRATGVAGMKWVDVNWVVPSGTTAFCAAVEQYYNYPSNDSVILDTGPSQGHSWIYYAGSWATLTSYGYNANLMVRLGYSPDYSGTGMQPSSLGRVKALYR